jgi:hypothetical protein
VGLQAKLELVELHMSSKKTKAKNYDQLLTKKTTFWMVYEGLQVGKAAVGSMAARTLETIFWSTPCRPSCSSERSACSSSTALSTCPTRASQPREFCSLSQQLVHALTEHHGPNLRSVHGAEKALVHARLQV